MNRFPFWHVIPLALTAVATSCATPPPTPLPNAVVATPLRPVAPKRPVTDLYHGVSIVDDYQWMENSGDPEVVAWSDGQNAATRTYLDRLPQRPAIDARLKEITRQRSQAHWGLKQEGDTLFTMTWRPGLEQPILVTLKDVNDPSSEQVVVDPNKLDPSFTTAIDWYEPSPDGKKVAVSLSQKGSEDGTVYVYDRATGERLSDVLPRVQRGTGGGSLAWSADSAGFYYTRYPQPGERTPEDEYFFIQIHYHTLGTPFASDPHSLGADFPRIAEVHMTTSDDHRYILANVQNGDGGDYRQYLLGPDKQWRPLTSYADRVKAGHFGKDGALYLLSTKDASHGKILRLPLSTPTLDKATVVVPPSDAVIQDMVPTADRLFIDELVGGPSQLRMVALDGKPLGKVDILPVSTVGQIEARDDGSLLFTNTSYTQPSAFYLFDPKSGSVKKTALAATSPVNFDDIEVSRIMATSKDGTQVPINLLYRKGLQKDGNNPLLLTGYGGYGISMTPYFDPGRRIWLDAGGVLAIANLRGGGEFGEEWHLQGNLLKKQNVFDDFIACAETLIQQRYTSTTRLAIEGGSNGGLLMGAVTTQRPELFRAVVSRVGIYDSVRKELTPNGAYNVTEYGTVKDPAQFAAIYAYSPYHNVKDSTRYPAMLFTTGANDPRVDPWHSRKMVARLQAANQGGGPIFLRTSNSTGHGGGTSVSTGINERADVLAFLFEQLWMKLPPSQ